VSKEHSRSRRSSANVCSLSVCLSVCITRKPRSRAPNFLCALPAAVALFSSNGVAIFYILPVLQMTLYIRTMGRIGGRTGTALCSSPAPVDMANAAQWLAGSAGRLAGARRPGRAMAVLWLDPRLLPGTVVLHAGSELHTGVKSAIYDCQLSTDDRRRQFITLCTSAFDWA